MRVILLALLLFPAVAGATERYKPKPRPGGDSHATALSQSKATSNSAANAVSNAKQQQQQKQNQKQQQQQTAQGGAATIASGAVTLNQGEDTLNNNNSITILGDSNKRNAPAVTVMPSPGTAEMMVCFGLGGSSTNGAATGAWCRLQRELYATHMGKTLASMGLYKDAATAYCSRKMHYRMFNGPGPGIETCKKQMIIGYRNQFPPIVKITGPPVPVPHTHEEFEQCDEKVKRCEKEVYK